MALGKVDSNYTFISTYQNNDSDKINITDEEHKREDTEEADKMIEPILGLVMMIIEVLVMMIIEVLVRIISHSLTQFLKIWLLFQIPQCTNFEVLERDQY